MKDVSGTHGEEKAEHVRSSFGEKSNCSNRIPIRRAFLIPSQLKKINGGASLVAPRDDSQKQPLAIQDSNSPTTCQQQQGKTFPGLCFRVLYTKLAPTKKRKNKSFMDGVMVVGGTAIQKYEGKIVLFSEDAKELSSTTLRGAQVCPENLESGSELRIGGWEVEIDVGIPAEDFASGACFNAGSLPTTQPLLNTFGANRAFRMVGRSQLAKTENIEPKRVFKPYYNPDAPGAVVLNHDRWMQNQDNVAPVVLNPTLVKRLRPHQIDGIKFLYHCISGERDARFCGAILADAMGLGKTITSLALVQTLLRQSPQGRPLVHKALVVTPSSLTQNWHKEVKKWFGEERLRSCVIQSGASGAKQVADFSCGKLIQVAFISYETLRLYADKLSACVGILIADEGHRLKSSSGSNKTIAAMNKFKTNKRIILTGTPVQNNLSELFSMVDFVNPGVLGDLVSFNRVFAAPISKSRDKSASEAEVQLGASRSAELKRILSGFVLRRDASVNEAFLPDLRVFAVFCSPRDAQVGLIHGILAERWKPDLLVRDDALSLLSDLRKICNHPKLVDGEFGHQDSGKMVVLQSLLQEISKIGDRTVVVSQSTAMLDLVQAICNDLQITTNRLDGSTPVNHRQGVVDSFNFADKGQVFLLSTAAGGSGLNLIGANRLILYDSHWNPALDAQAMARIWRPGQTRECTIYRLILSGCMDEKIFQRQILKGELAKITVDAGLDNAEYAQDSYHQSSGSFSRDELKELFEVDTQSDCMTHELLLKNGKSFEDCSQTCKDEVLRACIKNAPISFVYQEEERGGQSATPIKTDIPLENPQDDTSLAEAGADDLSQLDINPDF